jgi:hypothetical protein
MNGARWSLAGLEGQEAEGRFRQAKPFAGMGIFSFLNKIFNV